MEFINRLAEQFLKANRKMKRWQRAVSLLAEVVVFVTTYALVLPAITLDKETAYAQLGIEIAASDNEADSGGTVYEAEPEEEQQDAAYAELQEEVSEESQADGSEDLQENEAGEPQDAEPVDEDSGSQSDGRDAEVSEEENSDEDTATDGL